MAKLSTDQLQDVADHIGEMKKAATGCGLDITLTLEFGQETPPDSATVDKLNSILGNISEDFRVS